MFSKISCIYLVLTMSLISCAKPNYQNVNSIVTINEKQSSQTCELFFANQNICVDLEWEKVPTDSEMGSLFLKFYEKANPNLLIDPKYTPSVILWMPSMGHGSSPTKTEITSVGEYHITNVFFIMPGLWEIRIQLKDGQNVVEQVTQKITI